MRKPGLLQRYFLVGLLCGSLPTFIVLLSSALLEENSAQYVTVTPAPVLYSNVKDPYERPTQENKQEIATTSLPKVGLVLEHEYGNEGEEVAHEIAQKVRILCWVATLPKNHKTKAVHVRDTWGKRCNILIFMSSEYDSSLPAVALPVKEGREHLFDKTKAAMKYVYDHYLDSVDWVLKADDDTFVVVENLRYLLSKYNSDEALFLGCRFKTQSTAKQGFMSGGAGYVLSKEALRKFVEEGIPNKEKCRQSGIGMGEDVEIGTCLEKINVTAVDSRDELHRGRFFPYTPEFHLFPDHNAMVYDWYWQYQYYPDLEGLNCCSDTAVSYHYVSPLQLQLYNYLVYTLRPYGTSLYYRNASHVNIVI